MKPFWFQSCICLGIHPDSPHLGTSEFIALQFSNYQRPLLQPCSQPLQIRRATSFCITQSTHRGDKCWANSTLYQIDSNMIHCPPVVPTFFHDTCQFFQNDRGWFDQVCLKCLGHPVGTTACVPHPLRTTSGPFVQNHVAKIFSRFQGQSMEHFSLLFRDTLSISTWKKWIEIQIFPEMSLRQ